MSYLLLAILGACHRGEREVEGKAHPLLNPMAVVAMERWKTLVVGVFPLTPKGMVAPFSVLPLQRMEQ